jgi:transcriptional regulator with XRE-family HTH domain
MFLMQQIQREPTTPEENFGSAVSFFRSSKQLSQRDFAARLTGRGMPVDASAVSRIEKGSRSVRLVEAMTIAEVLEMDLESLIGGSKTDSQHLQTLRRRTDRTLQDLEAPFLEAAWALIDSKGMLENHPELLGTLNDDKLGGPQNVEGYFDWVCSRLSSWQLGDENTALVSTPEDRESLIELFTTFARMRLVTDLVDPESGESAQHGVDQETS